MRSQAGARKRVGPPPDPLLRKEGEAAGGFLRKEGEAPGGLLREKAEAVRALRGETAVPPQGRVARRRAAVRRRILEAAEKLIVERGVEKVTIDDIAVAADIARRSFYHHFSSKHEILVPIARARTAGLTRRIDRLIAAIADPGEVMATALRHGLRELVADPLCRWFVLYSGLPHERLFEAMGESAMRDLRRAIDAGRFHIGNPEVLRCMLSGAFVATVAGRADGTLGDAELDDAVEYFLRLFGVSREEARSLAHRPLPRLPAGSGSIEQKKKKGS